MIIRKNTYSPRAVLLMNSLWNHRTALLMNSLCIPNVIPIVIPIVNPIALGADFLGGQSNQWVTSVYLAT